MNSPRWNRSKYACSLKILFNARESTGITVRYGMYFFDLLSQYNRFRLGTLPASSFASWLFRVSDDMADTLTADEWDLFTDLENYAAEFTGEHIPESRFREVVDARMAKMPRTQTAA